MQLCRRMNMLCTHSTSAHANALYYFCTRILVCASYCCQFYYRYSKDQVSYYFLAIHCHRQTRQTPASCHFQPLTDINLPCSKCNAKPQSQRKLKQTEAHGLWLSWYVGNCSRGRGGSGRRLGEHPGTNVQIPMQDNKSLHVVVMIWANLVNTKRHADWQLLTDHILAHSATWNKNWWSVKFVKSCLQL